MSKPTFPEWLRLRYRKDGKYVDNRFGDLAKSLWNTVRTNPFEEDFNSYDTLEDWLRHLDIHFAPRSVDATMIEAWEAYVGEGAAAEIDFIRGDENEDT